MPRRNSHETVNSLVDAMEKRVKDLSDQVDSRHQQLGQQLSDGLASLRVDHVETRQRVNTAVAQATQAANGLAGLGNELGVLRTAIEDLRERVRQAPPPAPATVPATGSVTSPPSDPASDVGRPTRPDPDPVAPVRTVPEPSERTGPLAEPRDVSPASGADRAVPAAEGDPESAPEGGADDAEARARRAEAQARAAARKARASRFVTGTDAEEEAPGCRRASASPGSPARSCSEPVDEARVVESEEEEHHVHLLRAVRLSSVHLRCHRETWDFVASRAAGHQHVSATAEVREERQGRVRVTLSGRSLIGVLSILHEARVSGRQVWDGDWALAEGLYRGVTEALSTALSSGAEPLTVVFDDGVAGPDDTEEDDGTEDAAPRWG